MASPVGVVPRARMYLSSTTDPRLAMSIMKQRSSDAVVHCRDDDETVTKLLFLELDPTLRILLSLQRQLQATQPSARALPLLHKEHCLLIQLETSIDSFMVRENLEKQNEASASLCIMLKYLSLPLIVATKVPHSLDWNLTTELNDSSLLVRSIMYKCAGQAARVWKCLVSCIGVDRLHTEKDNLGDIWREAMTSLVSSLPTGQQVIDNQQISLTVLDRGEVCLQELLEAIVQLLSFCTSANLYFVWDGGLVVRLTDTCVAILSPIPAKSQDDRRHGIASRKARSLPVSLRLSAASALLALLHIDKSADSRQIWQHSFPGCFAGLYRALLLSLRLKHQHSQDSLTQTLIKCLTKLLQCTLLRSEQQPGDVTVMAADDSSPSAALQQLVHNANDEWNKEQHQGSLQPQYLSSEPVGAKEVSFLEQVKQKLPAPLMILIPLLTTVASVEAMREAASLLCTLHRARHCWDDGQMENCIYESCLLLSSRDGLDGQAMIECQQVMKISENNASTMEGKILDLICELKTLALKQSQEALQTNVRLATSLLSRLDRKSVRRLRVAFVSGNMAFEVVSCLIFVLDVEFSSQEPISSIRILETAVTEPNVSTRRTFQPRYLEAHALELVYAFMRELGRVLRPKTTATVVDSVLARMYQVCASRLENNASMVGPSQVQWLHEWIGAFPFIENLLLGSFESPSSRHLAILSDLIESILPVITRGALIDLPCHLIDIPSLQGERRVETTPALSSELSTLAIQGNTAIVKLQLELVGAVARLLRGETSRFLPLCLFPLLLKAVPESPVRDTAMLTLRSITFSCGYESLPGLIADNIASLIGTIDAALRIPGGGSLRGADEFDSYGTDVAGTTALIFQLLETADAEGAIDHRKQRTLVSLRGVVMELARRFDHSSTRLDSSTEKTAVYLRLFQCTLLYLLKEHATSTKRARCEMSSPREDPWLRLLEQFRQLPESPKDGFASAFKVSGNREDEAMDTMYREELPASTQYAAQVMSRCCYALSSQSLLIQTKSVDALICGFSYLGWIASNVPPAPDEANGPTTAILRQVHSTWTALAARVEAATRIVAADEADSTSITLFRTVTAANPSVSNQGEQRLFLSKLFVLVSVMSECAGDFMAVRLRESIWPCLSRVLSMFLRRLRHQPNGLNASRPTYTDSERGLLSSAFTFLERVYSQRSTGIALSKLIPQTGTTLLPFLGDPNRDVAEACMKAVQSMLLVDCDALWRPLLELSGRQMPTCPLLESSSRPRHDQRTELATRFAKGTDQVAVAAGKLVDFIDELPEQALD